MPSRSYQTVYQDVRGRWVTKSSASFTWAHSPRVGGVLKLRSNAASRSKIDRMTGSFQGNFDFYPSLPGVPYATSEFNPEMVELVAALQARFNRKLKGEASASLGITTATWRQSLDMIRKRVSTLHAFSVLCRRLALPKRAPPREVRLARKRARLFWLKEPNGRRLKKPRIPKVRHGSSADLFLEGFFGWMPLLADIYDSYGALLDDIPYGRVKTGATTVASRQQAAPLSEGSAVARLRASYSAEVKVTNPNLFLLNKLGLINPAIVLWDLVPWSFLINRVINIPSFLESFTANVGLVIGDHSLVRAGKTTQHATVRNSYRPTHPFFASASTTYATDFKSQTVSQPPPVSLKMRVPGFSLGQGIIDVSLLTQQLRRLSTR